MSKTEEFSVRAQVIGDHPHTGEVGRIYPDRRAAMGMLYFGTDACAHGNEHYYVGRKNLRLMVGPHMKPIAYDKEYRK